MLQEQQHEELQQHEQLPAGILQQVLSHVPLQQRLGSCSLASCSMHAAAVAATEEIVLEGLNSQQKACELGRWLARYGSQALRRPGVQGRMWQRPRHVAEAQSVSLALPSGLQQLQSLTLGHVVLPAVPDSYALPNLTCLMLDSCVVGPRSDVFAWVAQQLVHLPGLQSLHLHWLNGQANDLLEAGILALEEALGQLQQLTLLSLASNQTIDAALATISSLSQLQQLELDFVGSQEKPIQLHWLPSSLTSVRLD
jgi:hypothetical protein